MNESLNTDTRSVTPCDEIIIHTYYAHLPHILHFINNRIDNWQDANDLAQDAFVRLIEYKQMLREETVKSFIFTIARNLVIDYLRRQYRKIEVSANMYEFSKEYQETIESKIYAEDLIQLENGMLMTMPKQRKLIYMMDRFEEKSADEIADILQIKKRTVESHLFMGRKTVRDYLRRCI